MAGEDGPREGAGPASGLLYRIVTRHWPRIAAVLVFLVGASEWVIGGLTASSGIDFYLMAWAATTGGLWFLFERAEVALSPESRDVVADRVLHSTLAQSAASLPAQFALLFDRVFGEKHFTLRCFARSSVASVVGVVIMLGLWVAFHSPVCGALAYIPYSLGPEGLHAIADIWPRYEGYIAEAGLQPVGHRVIDLVGLVRDGGNVLALAMLFNLVPDYISLWETRVVLGRMSQSGAYVRAVLIDLVLTAVISLSAVFFGSWGLFQQNPAHWDEPLQANGWGETIPFSTSFLETSTSAGNQLFNGFVEYPHGRLAAGLAVGRDLVMVAPRFGSLMYPVVPTVYRVTVETALASELTAAATTSPEIVFPRGRLGELEERLWEPPPPWAFRASAEGKLEGERSARTMGLPFGLFFYSAFFTSFWLWLYVASVLFSRLLVRAGGGVGFLLQITDVARQPFRSIGFVSILLASALFALGLPLILLR